MSSAPSNEEHPIRLIHQESTSHLHLAALHRSRTYSMVPTDDIPEDLMENPSLDYKLNRGRREPLHTESSVVARRGSLVWYFLTPILGCAYVALGLYVAYGGSTVVVSYSTNYATPINQAFVALFALWHFIALAPALSLVVTIRSEEWWRRLLLTSPFARVNSISSNMGGNIAHLMEMLAYPSSTLYKLAWIVSILTLAIGDIAPGAIRVKTGVSSKATPFAIPAIPANSIYDDYSTPFFISNSQTHPSVIVAPVYYYAINTGTTINARPPSPFVVVPRPAPTPRTGYKYLTDVAILNYQCDWYAPEIGDPVQVVDITYQGLNITAGGIQGIGYPPFKPNDIYPLVAFTNPATGQPSFDGHVAFVVTSDNAGTAFDLSSIPTYTVSSAWQAAVTAWRVNQTYPSEPVQFMSVAVCSPNISIESWIVEFSDGAINLIQQQPQTVGNLDKTQLQILAQDCFNQLPVQPPIDVVLNLAFVQLSTLFETPFTLPLTPFTSERLSLQMNWFALPSSIQAYLDGSPFGNISSSDSEILLPALVLTAQPGFIIATAMLYALLSGICIYLFYRSQAKSLTIRHVLGTIIPHDVNPESNAALRVREIAMSQETQKNVALESEINQALGGDSAVVIISPDRPQGLLQLYPKLQGVEPAGFFHRYRGLGTRILRVSWAVTLIVGGTLVVFGVASQIHPRVVLDSPTPSKANLLASVFTWAIGVWRSLSLVAINIIILQANSDEWSHFIDRGETITRSLAHTLDTISTNALSLPESFNASVTKGRTSMVYKIAFTSSLIVAICTIVAQGVATMVVLPTISPVNVSIPMVGSGYPIFNVPWSADLNLAPQNEATINVGRADVNYVYLEKFVGASITDSMPYRYLVPILERTNSTTGVQYPTDVLRFDFQCDWHAPNLAGPPLNANESLAYTAVELSNLEIVGLQSVPHGLSQFAAISNMTFTSNSTPVTSGIFAWTLWGGGSEDPVNLNSVPYSNLSVAWQELIAAQLAPAYLTEFPGDRSYLTNLTRASTLVCDPQIQVETKVAQAFDGSITLLDDSVPLAYAGGIGNIDVEYASYMIYNYAVQQALDVVGNFRPFLIFGTVPGNATLQIDPENPNNGTIPRSGADIALSFNSYVGSSSKWWLAYAWASQYMTVNGHVIRESLVIKAALPQVIAAGVLYLLLVSSAAIIGLRKAGVPFTLAGILMLYPKLSSVQILKHSQD